jgi:hypothetical protein
MNILGVERIYYGVADVDFAARFHDHWGLTKREAAASGADYALADGTTIHLRRAADNGLPAAVIDWAELNDSTAREIIWGVDNQTTLDAIGAEITKDRETKSGGDGILRCRCAGRGEILSAPRLQDHGRHDCGRALHALRRFVRPSLAAAARRQASRLPACRV